MAWKRVLTDSLPLLTIPSLLGYGWLRYNKHLFGIFKEKDRLAYSSEEIPLDESTQKIVDELMVYVLKQKWNTVCVAGIRVFWSNTQDPVVRGSTSTNQGSLIGLPYSFSYQNIADIDTSKIVLTGKKEFDWKSGDGEKLLSSLILSENAKKFAIARELHFINSRYVHIQALAGIICAGIGIACIHRINRSSLLHFDKTKQSFRVLMYIAVGLVLAYLHQESLKVYYKNLHLSADTKAAGIGQDYAVGGVEYFTKMLKRNQAVRKLTGYTGAQKYTPWGDEYLGIFSVNKIPSSYHLRHVVGQAKKLYGGDGKNVNELIENIVGESSNEKEAESES